MKTLYLIGGTMGVGKTTVSQQLKKDLITTSTSKTTLNIVFPNKNPLKQHFVISEGYI